MIDDISIDLWFFENFASIENIRRKCNIMVDLLKFTSNKKKILSRVVTLSYNKVYCQILFFIKDDVLFLVILAHSNKDSRSLNKILLQKKKKIIHNFVKKWPDIVTIFFFFFLRWDFKGNRECKNKINYNKM